MLSIRRIADPRLAQRVCSSFGVDEKGAFAYAAYQREEVLATAAFLTEPGGCVVFCGADTGRRTDVDLVDGLVRAAFSAQRRAGAKTARIGEQVGRELRLALTKLNYPAEGAFDLDAFFANKRCC